MEPQRAKIRCGTQMTTGSAPRALPFSQGIAWLLQSISLMRLQAGRLLLIAVIMQIILGLTQLPLIGLLVTISVPGLSAGVLEAFESAVEAAVFEQTHRPAVAHGRADFRCGCPECIGGAFRQ